MNRAETFKAKGEWLLMAAASEAAIKSVPAGANQYVALSVALREQAAVAKSPSERDKFYREADRVLEKGGRIRPLATHFPGYRGDLYTDWAEAESEPGKRAMLAAQAIRFYQQAAVLDPGNFDLFNRLAYVELAVRKAPGEARRWLERALELCPISHKAYGLLGDASFHQALALAETNTTRTIHFQTAATNYLLALKLVRTNRVEGYRYALALGKSSVQLRDLPQAIGAYRAARSRCPPAERWLQEERLARLYADLKDRTNAVAHVRQALDLAPAEKRSALITLREQILGLR